MSPMSPNGNSMSPLQIQMLLNLHAYAYPFEGYSRAQIMAPAMIAAFERFQENGLLAEGVTHAAVAATTLYQNHDRVPFPRLSAVGEALVHRLCNVSLEDL